MDIQKPRDEDEVLAAVRDALEDERPVEILGHGIEARARAPGQGHGADRHQRPDRHHAVRTLRAGDDRAAGHADGRYRQAARREPPGARLRADGPFQALARQFDRHARRHGGGQCRRPAPHQGRRRARPRARLPRRVRPGRDLQVGRPGDEERHRLRPVEARRRLLRHARGADRDLDQGAAARRDRADPSCCTASTRRRRWRRCARRRGCRTRCRATPACRTALMPAWRRAAAWRCGWKGLRSRSTRATTTSSLISARAATSTTWASAPPACSGQASATSNRSPAWPARSGKCRQPRARARPSSRTSARPRCRWRAGTYDWAGGLVWLALEGADAHATAIRAALAPHGGHATLVRADETVRATTPVFQPQPGPLAALSRRVKTSFDPLLILNRGRLGLES